MAIPRKVVLSTIGVLAAFAIGVLSVVPPSSASAAGPGGAGRGPGGAGGGMPGRSGRGGAPVDTGPRSLAPYFTPAAAGAKAPDTNGFLQRWLLLEPISQSIRSNAIFTDSWVRNAMKTQNFPDQFMNLAHDGDKVTVGGQELAWHALDSTAFNVKLFRFAYGLSKTTTGVLFFAETVVNSPREMPNVRLAVGSNSASIWWLNGKESVDLFGDRRMVQDDVVSQRLTLNKGANTLHGAVINGPGMSDFCVRFIDEQGEPIKDLTVSLEKAAN